VTYAQGAQVTINGYFDLCVPVTAEQPDELQCSAIVAGDTEAGYVIRGAADSAGVGANSPQIVYTHGEEEELLALVNGNVTDEILLTSYLAGIVEPAAAAAFGLPGILGGLGAAAVAAAGGGGSSEGGGGPSAPVANNPGEISAITGTLTQGEMLTAGEITDVDGVLKADGTTPVDITYQWKADGEVITDATAKTYTLTQAEVGKVITVVAIYTDGGNTEETVTSKPTSAVVTVAQAALQSIIDAAETDTAEPLTLDDFIVAGVKNITANGTGETEVGLNSIKSALNSLLVDAEAVDTLGKLQGVVDSYLAILQAADGDTTTDPTKISEADFTNIGVDMRQVKEISHDALVKLLFDVVGGWEDDGVDLVPKLQAIVDAAIGVMAGMGEEAEGGKPSVDDLQNLGITDVTADNIFAIRAKFKKLDSAGTDYDTLGNLQMVVSNTVTLYTTALERIQALSTSPSLELYYEDRHTEQGAKIFATYETIFGSVVINASTLAGVEHSDTFELNDAKFIFRLLLGENTKVGQLDTYVEVQALVDGANAIRATFNSSTSILPVPVPLQEHYEVIGLTGVDTQAEVDLMGDVISKLIDADAEAYGQFELQALANAVQHVINAATGDTAALTVDDLNLLGISNVVAANFDDLKQKIAATGDVNAVDSVTEIQLIVSGLGRSLVRVADTEMGSAISLGSNSEEDALISNFEISDLAVTENATLELNITDLVTLSGDSFDFSYVAKTTGEVYTPEAAYTVSDQTMTSESYDVYLADNKAAELWHNPEIAVVI
jgi:hypothetical protein